MFSPNFTPFASALGGVLIGLAAAIMLVFNGRIAGISGIVGGLLEPGDRDWRGTFVLGLLVGGVLLRVVAPQTLPGPVVTALPVVIAGGLLVGFGTRMGGGCTSGHGVCGMSRLSLRSLTATAIFMGAAMLTVGITRHLIGVGS